MSLSSSLKLGLLFGSLTLAACGGMAPEASSPAAADTAAPGPKPALERSLFGRDAGGTLTEADLQRILDARFDVELPARIGVVALDAAFNPETRAPVAMQAIVAKTMSRSLKGSTHFSAVTDVSTELPNQAGLEGLRTIAARYRTRYLLLTSAITEDRSHLNNWAWLYATGVGVLLFPGQTVATNGLLEASLFDVKTGTVLYTVREPFQTSSVTWLVGSGREHAEVDGEAISEAAQRLAKKALMETEELARWVKEEHEKERVANASKTPAPPPAVTTPTPALAERP
jgi:rhombotail lipoprotein